MEVFNLNLVPGKTMPVIHCSQFDKGRTFRANLFDGVTVFTLTGAETLSVIEKKDDGNMVTIAVTNTSDSYVEFATTEQMTALAGPQLCELRIEDGADLIGTLNFILDCEESPDTGIASDSAIHNLEDQVAAIVADQYDSANVVFDNTPTAGHGVGFAVTSEGVKTELDLKANSADLATVATSGDYNDLSNLPTIPTDLDSLTDVTITTPSDDEILVYDNGEWVNKSNPASTTNFGAPYDENTTYNVPSLVINNNLLYKLNDGEDGTTGPWDPTKWTQTSVAELATAIGDLSTLTTSVQSSLVGAVNELDSDKANASDVSTINTYITGQGNVQRATLPSGNLTIGDIQTWCNTANAGFYWGICYLTSPFSGWAVVQIVNKMVASSYAEIMLTMNEHIISSFTSNMTTWTTKSSTLS